MALLIEDLKKQMPTFHNILQCYKLIKNRLVYRTAYLGSEWRAISVLPEA